jgi:beta-glucosidase
MERFGDRLDALSTFNEPWCSSILSHLYGVHAPGTRNLDTTLAVLHGQHVAHGLAVQAMRAARSDIPLGIVLNIQSVYPAADNDRDHAAAQRHDTFHNGLFLDPLFKGEYPADAVVHLGDRLPARWEDDLTTISQPLDFWGLNYYTPSRVTDAVAADAHYPATLGIDLPGVPRTDIGWEVNAATLRDLLVDLNARYTLPPCYITENGAAYNHDLANGVVADAPRIEYLQQHLAALLEAIDEGVAVKGYFAWSLMDNFEWAEGYAMRFGLVHVNYATQERTLKDSAHWYQSLMQRRRG